MPLALPAAQLAWNRSLQNRCVYSSLQQAVGDVMYVIANELINVRGHTCKGSSDGVVAGMDAVFRWASGNDAKQKNAGSAGAQSWVVITLADGRGDVVMSYNTAPGGALNRDDIFAFWWSPSGITAAAGTATHEPTAADKVLLNGIYTNSLSPSATMIGASAGDRLVSIWSRPDKRGFRVAVATGGAWGALFGADVFTPDEYGAGIALLDVAAFYINGGFNGNAAALINQSATASDAAAFQKRFVGRRTNGAGTNLDLANKCKIVGGTTASAALNVTADIATVPDLQGGAIWPMKKYGLYSVTSGHRGDIGTLIDWYLSRTGAADGDTAGDLEWVCVEATASMWWSWDGTTAVVMS